ncbi:MAG: pilus assembly protein TadG-related protein, partial [Candidatus Sulfotelmatobacter sp.]
MALVAMTIVAIISMAALSIDIGTLYEAKAEAQRAADAAALTAARVISISGITGDPANATSSWQLTCGGTSSPATLAAISVAQTNLVSGIAVPTANVTVNYGAGRAGGASQD